MKTLDEVIKAKELCELNCSDEEHCQDCPYAKQDANGDWSFFCHDCEADALQYLKWYKELADDSEAFAQWKENPPLTWDELKQMEGKPVWVEVLSDEIDLSSRWMLVARETKAHSLPLAYTDDIGHWIFGHEDKLGKVWQAYRKERK